MFIDYAGMFLYTDCVDFYKKYILAPEDHQVKEDFLQCQEKCFATDILICENQVLQIQYHVLATIIYSIMVQY